jgi:acetyltransferase-like isoleucine patch superfamily enzyme
MTDATASRLEAPPQPRWRRAWTALTTEFVGIHPRLHLYSVLSSLLPLRLAGELRAAVMAKVGFDVGEGTRVNGPLKITGPRGLLPRLSIGKNCTIEPDCMLDLSDSLTIGDRVTLEPGVMILTSTHELDFPKHRAGKVIVSPVSIGDGAWLRARAVILPGVKIGVGAVVEVGAVVNKDVESNTRVGGVPAVKLGVLDGHEA